MDKAQVQVQKVAFSLRKYTNDTVLARRIAQSIVVQGGKRRIDPALLVGVVLTEDAKLDPRARSFVGARGLMQVMPFHAGKWSGCPSADLFAIDTNIRQVNTVVYNADGRRESRELLDRLKNSDTFHIMRYVQDDNALNDAIISGRARVGVKIPVDYSDRLLHHMSAQVLVLIDGSDSSVAGQAINVTTAIGLDESLRRVLQDRLAAFPVDMRPKILFNPDSRSPNFFLPGLTAVLLLNVTTFLTAFSIVREKERGTLEQLFVTPVRPMGLLFAAPAAPGAESAARSPHLDRGGRPLVPAHDGSVRRGN